MKVGDLVTDAYWPPNARVSCITGIVVAVIDTVEIPPLIEVLWDNGKFSKTYQDELELINAD